MINLIKVRIEGELKEINKGAMIFQNSKPINILSKSEPYKNRGNNSFYRIYIDADINEGDKR